MTSAAETNKWNSRSIPHIRLCHNSFFSYTSLVGKINFFCKSVWYSFIRPAARFPSNSESLTITKLYIINRPKYPRKKGNLRLGKLSSTKMTGRNHHPCVCVANRDKTNDLDCLPIWTPLGLGGHQKGRSKSFFKIKGSSLDAFLEVWGPKVVFS